VDVGIKLYVTHTINDNGFISMKIRPEISSSKNTTLTSDDKKTTIPIVTTSEAETSVLVKDGVTIVIGGLKKDKRDKTTKRVPILGDIPLLGYFFGSTSDDFTKTELVILLTPHIMSGETSYTEFSQIPPKEGARMEMVKGKIVSKKFSQADEALKEAAVDSAYFLTVFDKIKRFSVLDRPRGQKGVVDVSFTLESGGRLKGEPRINSATNYSLVPVAVRNIVTAAPFPAFPKGMDKREESFRISLEYD
jgi:Flp pilus assembly secretin CpaC